MLRRKHRKDVASAGRLERVGIALIVLCVGLGKFNLVRTQK